MTERKTVLYRLAACFVLLALAFSFAACGRETYPEIASSKEEATVVATLGDHEVKYELFRAFFTAMYSGKTADMTEEGWNEAVSAVLREIAYIYATLDVAKANGVDPYGATINDKVSELVRIEYEGQEVNGVRVEGCGTKEEYKRALAAANMTDAVNRLIFRYDATQAELYEYLVTNYSFGNVHVTPDEARAFFDSSDCAHGVWIFISYEFRSGRASALAYAEEIRERLASATEYSEIRQVLIETFSDQVLSRDEMENGFYVGRHQGNIPAQRKLVSDVFSLEPYRCGEPVYGEDGIYIAVGLPKNVADYEATPNYFLDLLIEERCINRPIFEAVDEMTGNVKFSSAFPDFTPETLAKLTVR